MESDRIDVRPIFNLPLRLKPLPDQFKDMGEIPSVEYKIHENASLKSYKGGESEGLRRIDDYLAHHIKTYKETRNGLMGEEFSTKFSAYFAVGCISARDVYFKVKQFEENMKEKGQLNKTEEKSTYWVIFEILWRDFCYFFAKKHGSALFHLDGAVGSKNEKYDREWKTDEKLWRPWVEGNTGIPFIDANMREISQTGLMSNRGRQNVASFLTKDLMVDWRLGAEW